jgi:tripartite-type tricarboxylate transporter receptor subunit TctC
MGRNVPLSVARSIVTAAALALFVGFAARPAAAAYPDRPIRLLISFPPGGSSDAMARIVQPGMEKLLGQPIVIENRAGAGGMIAIDAVAKAAPDGYLIGLGGAGALGTNLGLGEKMPYDPRKNIAPVSALAASPFILAASPSFSGKSLRDVIELPASQREKAAIGHGGNGTLMHLTAEMFNQRAGTKLPLIPYRGTALVVSDLIGNHLALGIIDPPSGRAAFEADKVKPVAISSGRRFPRLPDIPTFAESGLPGFEATGWFGFVAPAGTPPRSHRQAQFRVGKGPARRRCDRARSLAWRGADPDGASRVC